MRVPFRFEHQPAPEMPSGAAYHLEYPWGHVQVSNDANEAYRMVPLTTNRVDGPGPDHRRNGQVFLNAMLLAPDEYIRFNLLRSDAHRDPQRKDLALAHSMSFREGAEREVQPARWVEMEDPIESLENLSETFVVDRIPQRLAEGLANGVAHDGARLVETHKRQLRANQIVRGMRYARLTVWGCSVVIAGSSMGSEGWPRTFGLVAAAGSVLGESAYTLLRTSASLAKLMGSSVVSDELRLENVIRSSILQTFDRESFQRRFGQGDTV